MTTKANEPVFICQPYLVEDVRHILLVGRLLYVAQLWGILGGNEAVITHQGHTHIGHLVALEVDLACLVTCTCIMYGEITKLQW